MKHLLSILASLALLAGCAGQPAKPQVRYQNVLIAPDDVLLQDCPVAQPPDVDAYVKADWSGKEKMLTDMLQLSTENLIVCNVSKQGLRDWKAKQVQIFSADKAASSP